LEKAVIQGGLDSQTRGSWFGFIIGLIVTGGGIYLMAHGKDGWGFASIIGALGALVTVFIVGRKKENKELKNKSDALQKRMPRSG
jgi:hypothetical protein